MNKRGELFGYLNDKKGQVTLFIIIALLVVGAAALFFFLSPELRTDTPDFDETNPQAFMQTCLEDDLKDIVEKVSLQGGSIEPGYLNITFNGVDIAYLCYTNEDLTGCTEQQPLLKRHIESEIEKELVGKGYVEDCFNSLVASYDERNYETDPDQGATSVNLLPNRIIVNMSHVLTVSRTDTERFEDFNVVLNNNLYELVMITHSMIEEEKSGREENLFYDALYRHLQFEKRSPEYGTAVYIITNTNTEDKFQFATRSVVKPYGYGPSAGSE
ncbi:MAG: hypothetical protein WDZ69_01145 [Candidatus Pacearchaeota archaeon]